ncbi:MAG: OmpH family outer membrane protein [Burkholderiales bacterium]
MITLRYPGVIAVAVLLAATMSASAFAQTKIGFVNTERILRDSAPAAQASKRLESEFAKKQQDLQKLADQLKKMQSDLEKNGVTMSDTQRRAKERDFNDLNRDLQRRDRDFRDEVNQRRNEEMAQLLDKANRVIRQIAERENYDAILQDGVYVSPRIDITDKVIKALEGKPPAK